MNAVTDHNLTPAARGLKNSAMACLFLSWITFVQPIPGLGLLFGLPLNFVAFVLAIVIIAKGLRGGIGLLLASLVVTPVIWVMGMATTLAAGSAMGAH